MHPLSKDRTPIISEYWKHSVVHKNGATLHYVWDDASCCFFLFSNTWRNVNAGLINFYFIFFKTAVFTVVQYTNMFSFFFFLLPNSSYMKCKVHLAVSQQLFMFHNPEGTSLTTKPPFRMAWCLQQPETWRKTTCSMTYVE